MSEVEVTSAVASTEPHDGLLRDIRKSLGELNEAIDRFKRGLDAHDTELEALREQLRQVQEWRYLAHNKIESLLHRTEQYWGRERPHCPRCGRIVVAKDGRCQVCPNPT